MTQIRAFAKRMDITINNVEVKARLHWIGVQQDNDPYVSHPKGFDLDVDIDSPADGEALRALLEAAKKGCFIEQSLTEGVVVGHRLKVDGKWQEC